MIIQRGGQLELLDNGRSSQDVVNFVNARRALLDTGLSLLRKHVQQHQAYVLVVRNDFPSAACIVAAAKLQHVCILLPASRMHLLAYVQQHTGINVLVDATNELVQGKMKHVPWIEKHFGKNGGVGMLTSGSTGMPKIVACSWSSMMAQGNATQELMFPNCPCRFAVASSIAHAYAINALFAILTSPHGDMSELIMANGMNALVPFLSQRVPGKTTVVFGTPGTYLPLVQLTPVKLYADLVYSAGVSMSDSLKLKLRESFGLNLLQNYGSTETGGIAAEGIIQSDVKLPNHCVGHIWPGAQVRIEPLAIGMVCRPGEEGELVVKTPWQCSGYIENEQVNGISRDGFYNTNDAGSVVSNHILMGQRLRAPVCFQHNKLHLFIPRHEIEDAIATHPSITDVLIPHTSSSAIVILIVSTLPLDQLEQHVYKTLPSIPQNIQVRKVDHLFCSPAGKLIYCL
ncbi:hypothetical protein THRCLA_02989 [Thraustotheca clavata]|uniref:AMP-dependent synthetase/ligase domain-containing protein n=1 Tax=Thraustotheca clavata TaxID=74557 RepID=A0A1W0A3F5_9STRA|nr:hypothetical protein THRCLA_02989 [Thraustotheca clavata]